MGENDSTECDSKDNGKENHSGKVGIGKGHENVVRHHRVTHPEAEEEAAAVAPADVVRPETFLYSFRASCSASWHRILGGRRAATTNWHSQK